MPQIIIVLDNVRSAFNVGSVFRTSDGLNAQINLIGIAPLPGKDSKLEKTSLNSLEYVKWEYFNNQEEWLASIANESKVVISVEESKDLTSSSLFDLKDAHTLKSNYDKVYIVFGHEISGVSKEILSKSDLALTIPMYGKKNSLNVATCVGIVGYRVKEILSK